MKFIQRCLSAIIDVGLIVLIILVGISYHPIIVDMSRAEQMTNGTILSRPIAFLFAGILGLVVLRNGFKFLKSRFILTTIVMLVFVGCFALITIALYNNATMFGDVKSLVIVIGAMIIGRSMNPHRRYIYLLIISFCATVLFSGLMQVLINIGGFVIADQYLADAKNSLGALLATASVSLLFLYKNATSNPILRVISIAGVFLGLLVILIIRARMAFLTVALVFLFYFLLRFRKKNILSIGIFALFGFVAGYFLLNNSVFEFISESFTAGTQGDNFTSGRLETYREALSYFVAHPFLGNIDKAAKIGWVHNYPLLKLTSYGIIFSIPILVIYFYMAWSIISNARKTSGFCLAASLVLLVPFIISMAEPTFPFGPGTATFYNFLLFGQGEKIKHTMMLQKSSQFNTGKQ